MKRKAIDFGCTSVNCSTKLKKTKKSWKNDTQILNKYSHNL